MDRLFKQVSAVFLMFIVFSNTGLAHSSDFAAIETLVMDIKSKNTKLLEKKQFLIQHDVIGKSANSAQATNIIQIHNSTNSINTILLYQAELLFLHTVCETEIKVAYTKVQVDILEYSKKLIDADIKEILKLIPEVTDPIVSDAIKSIVELSKSALNDLEKSIKLLSEEN